MSAIASLILDAAIKVGAPVVKSILADRFGAGGALAGTVIDAVAGKAGVPPEEIPSINPNDLQAAVRQVEKDSPELVLAYVAQQKEANRLMLAEMEKSEGFFGWGWRPSWMWLLGALWTWALIVAPIIKAALWPGMVLVDLAMLLGVTSLYLGLYMGGHTIKKTVGDRRPSGLF
ncbi:3TM-type holin [Pararhizobium haloflavum]|uniref:3TM-type holin n=1 Tax=Pararhizobium haloflavum TaxID=2037914 RepID=UPI000C1A8470|nr:3TM-type holin [Pararhizobium haloflavum]